MIPSARRNLITYGPIVAVTIRRHPSRRTAELSARAAELAALGLTPPDAIDTELLVDTGARETVVDAALMESLGIVPHVYVDRIQLVGAVATNVPAYRVEMTLHLTNGQVDLRTTVLGLHGHLDGARFHGLLGRTSLSDLEFVYKGPSGEFDLRAPR